MKILLAHRGIHKVFKENTIKAFAEIFKYKSNIYKLGVECDVNMTADNQLIVYHNEYLNNHKIIDLSYKDIVSINKGIPLLYEVLNLFDNTDYYLNIELKKYPVNKKLYCDTLYKTLSGYNINYIISSFDIDIVKYLRSLGINSLSIGPYGNIIHYTDEIRKHTVGVYTLYDNKFDSNRYLKKSMSLDIIITDDLDKLLKPWYNLYTIILSLIIIILLLYNA